MTMNITAATGIRMVTETSTAVGEVMGTRAATVGATSPYAHGMHRYGEAWMLC